MAKEVSNWKNIWFSLPVITISFQFQSYFYILITDSQSGLLQNGFISSLLTAKVASFNMVLYPHYWQPKWSPSIWFYILITDSQSGLLQYGFISSLLTGVKPSTHWATRVKWNITYNLRDRPPIQKWYKIRMEGTQSCLRLKLWSFFRICQGSKSKSKDGLNHQSTSILVLLSVEKIKRWVLLFLLAWNLNEER